MSGPTLITGIEDLWKHCSGWELYENGGWITWGKSKTWDIDKYPSPGMGPCVEKTAKVITDKIIAGKANEILSEDFIEDLTPERIQRMSAGMKRLYGPLLMEKLTEIADLLAKQNLGRRAQEADEKLGYFGSFKRELQQIIQESQKGSAAMRQVAPPMNEKSMSDKAPPMEAPPMYEATKQGDAEAPPSYEQAMVGEMEHKERGDLGTYVQQLQTLKRTLADIGRTLGGGAGLNDNELMYFTGTPQTGKQLRAIADPLIQAWPDAIDDRLLTQLSDICGELDTITKRMNEHKVQYQKIKV